MPDSQSEGDYGCRTRAKTTNHTFVFSSTFGHEGAAGASIYSASKHAVEGLTRSAALEVATTGVRVNAVAPGPIDTGMLDRFTGGDAGKDGGKSAG